MAAVEAAEQLRNPVQAVDADRLEIGPQHGLDRALPAAFDPQLLGGARLVVHRMRLQPLSHAAGRLSERGLLQGLGRHLSPEGLLPLIAQEVERLGLLAFAVPRVGERRQNFRELGRRPLAGIARRSRLLGQRLQRLGGLLLRERRTLGLLPLLLRQEAALLIFDLLDSRALDLGLALRMRHRLRMPVPGDLPFGERAFPMHQRFRGAALVRVRRVETRQHLLQLGAQRLELHAVPFDHARQFLNLGLRLLQVRGLALPQLARMLDALLDAGDFGTRPVETRLNRAQGLGLRRLIDPDPFDLGLDLPQLGEHALHGGFAAAAWPRRALRIPRPDPAAAAPAVPPAACAPPP